MLPGIKFENVKEIRKNGYHLIDDDDHKVVKVFEGDIKIAKISYQKDGQLQLKTIINKKQSRMYHDISTVIIQPLSNNGILFIVRNAYGLKWEISKKGNNDFFSVIIDE